MRATSQKITFLVIALLLLAAASWLARLPARQSPARGSRRVERTARTKQLVRFPCGHHRLSLRP